MENSEVLETCLSKVSESKELHPSAEKILDSDHSATITSRTMKSTTLRKTLSDQNFDNDELLRQDSARDLLLKNALNLPEVIGRREKLV